MDAKVHYPVELRELLPLLAQPDATQTLMIVCTDRASFVHLLLQSHGQDNADNRHFTRTLHSIQISRRIDVAFCTTVPHLHAYLTSLRKPVLSRAEARKPTLILLNPISLHRSAQAFSGQSIGKTFAVTVESALDSGRSLKVIECAWHARNESTTELAPESEVLAENAESDLANQPAVATDRGQDARNPWNVQVPILSPLSRLSEASERSGWLTRTVSLATIASQWFDFEPPPARGFF